MSNIYWVIYKKKKQSTTIKRQFLDKSLQQAFIKRVKADPNLIFVGEKVTGI